MCLVALIMAYQCFLLTCQIAIDLDVIDVRKSRITNFYAYMKKIDFQACRVFQEPVKRKTELLKVGVIVSVGNNTFLS